MDLHRIHYQWLIPYTLQFAIYINSYFSIQQNCKIFQRHINRFHTFNITVIFYIIFVVLYIFLAFFILIQVKYILIYQLTKSKDNFASKTQIAFRYTYLLWHQPIDTYKLICRSFRKVGVIIFLYMVLPLPAIIHIINCFDYLCRKSFSCRWKKSVEISLQKNRFIWCSRYVIYRLLMVKAHSVGWKYVYEKEKNAPLMNNLHSHSSYM